MTEPPPATRAVERTLIQALGHPVRLRILELVRDHDEESPAGLSRHLGVPLSTISRHVRVLRDLGYLELRRTQPRRGAVEHFYGTTKRAFIDDADWELLPVTLRRGLARQTFRKVFAEASAAGAAGGFDASDAQLRRMPVALDARGRRELAKAVDAFAARVDEIQRASDARRRGDDAGGDGTHASVVALLHFRPLKAR